MKSKYFELGEFLRSDTAKRNNIDNSPNEKQKKNIAKLMPYMDTIREYLKLPIKINSGFRCGTLNRKVGGTKNSIHKTGLAVDFTFKGINESQMKRVAKFVVNNFNDFDQLIIYPDRYFIHINLRDKPRNMLLRKLKNSKYTVLKL